MADRLYNYFGDFNNLMSTPPNTLKHILVSNYGSKHLTARKVCDNIINQQNEPKYESDKTISNLRQYKFNITKYSSQNISKYYPIEPLKILFSLRQL